MPSSSLQSWELVELWPRRPESAWEGWVYLSVFLENRFALSFVKCVDVFLHKKILLIAKIVIKIQVLFGNN